MTGRDHKWVVSRVARATCLEPLRETSAAFMSRSNSAQIRLRQPTARSVELTALTEHSDMANRREGRVSRLQHADGTRPAAAATACFVACPPQGEQWPPSLASPPSPQRNDDPKVCRIAVAVVILQQQAIIGQLRWLPGIAASAVLITRAPLLL